MVIGKRKVNMGVGLGSDGEVIVGEMLDGVGVRKKKIKFVGSNCGILIVFRVGSFDLFKGSKFFNGFVGLDFYSFLG